jgi:hypothetical protein
MVCTSPGFAFLLSITMSTLPGHDGRTVPLNTPTLRLAPDALARMPS